MTLQCCGPHSARPASANLCLHSDSKHTHHYTFKPCTKISLHRQQLQMLIQAGTHTHRYSDSRYLFVSPCSCSIHLYPRLPSVAVSIYKTCLNLFLTLMVSFSAQYSPHHWSASCPYSWALQRISLDTNLWTRGFPKTSSSLSCQVVLSWPKCFCTYEEQLNLWTSL